MLAGVRLADALLGFLLVTRTAWADEEACTNSGVLAIDGADSTFLAGSVDNPNEKASFEGDKMKFPRFSGYSLMKSCQKKWDPREFKVLQLLGRKFTFVADLSKVGCACNVSVYLTQAPACGPSGNFSEGECPWGPCYCDANRVCGQSCPELAIMEANNHVFSSWLHSCDAPLANSHYKNCDKDGCGQSTTHLGWPAYGPGSTFTIDTTKPFEVISEFHGSETNFTGFLTKLRQMQGGEERLVTLDHAACVAGPGRMTAAMAAGMTLRITYGWNFPPCSNRTCSGEAAGNVVISSLGIAPPIAPEPRPETPPPPPPPPPPRPSAPEAPPEPESNLRIAPLTAPRDAAAATANAAREATPEPESNLRIAPLTAPRDAAAATANAAREAIPEPESILQIAPPTAPADAAAATADAAREATPNLRIASPSAPPPRPSAFSVAFAGWEQVVVFSAVSAMLLTACFAAGAQTAARAQAAAGVQAADGSQRNSSFLLWLAESGGSLSASPADDLRGGCRQCVEGLLGLKPAAASACAAFSYGFCATNCATNCRSVVADTDQPCCPASMAAPVGASGPPERSRGPSA